MGKVKKAKKFRKNHLKDKVQQHKAEKKHAKLVHKRTSPRAAAPDHKEEVSFDAPAEEFALDKYISDSEAGSDPEGSESAASDEGSEPESEPESESESESSEPEKVLDKETVREWTQGLRKSPKNIKLIVRSFNADTVDTGVADALLDACLVAVPAALTKFFPDPNSKRVAKEFSGCLKQYCGQLAQLVRDNPSAKVIAAVQQALPYFRSFRKALKGLIKALVGIVASSHAADDALKLEIFSVVRSCQEPELVLKLGYEALVLLAGRTTAHTLPAVNLAKNLFATLYSGSPQTYQIAFQQLRTLALHLKTALDRNKNPGYDIKVVYTWSYIHMLDYWSRAVSLCPELHGLIHPLVQVSLRAATLVPSAQYLPLRFYLVRSLARLSKHTGVYIPLLPPLVEVLSMTTLTHKGKPATLQQLDLSTVLHVPQSFVGTRVYQTMIGDELVDIMTEVLVLYAKSIAFPELAAPVLVTIKRASKKLDSNPKLARQLGSWCERVQANSDFIAKRRSGVTFGPRDTAHVAAFLKDDPWEQTPLGQLAVARQKVRDERAAAAAATEQGSDSDMDLEADLE